MSEYWRPIKIKSAYAARCLQMSARQHFEAVKRSYPDQEALDIAQNVIKLSEELVSDCDADVYPIDHITSFDY